MKEKKSMTYWFIRPLDTHTKNSVMEGLLGTGETLNPSSPMDNVSVRLDKELPMISVPEYFFMAFIARSATDSGYKYEPYSRQSDEIFARVWKLDKRKKTARNKKMRRIKKEVEEAKKRLAEKIS